MSVVSERGRAGLDESLAADPDLSLLADSDVSTGRGMRDFHLAAERAESIADDNYRADLLDSWMEGYRKEDSDPPAVTPDPGVADPSTADAPTADPSLASPSVADPAPEETPGAEPDVATDRTPAAGALDALPEASDGTFTWAQAGRQFWQGTLDLVDTFFGSPKRFGLTLAATVGLGFAAAASPVVGAACTVVAAGFAAYYGAKVVAGFFNAWSQDNGDLGEQTFRDIPKFILSALPFLRARGAARQIEETHIAKNANGISRAWNQLRYSASKFTDFLRGTKIDPASPDQTLEIGRLQLLKDFFTRATHTMPRRVQPTPAAPTPATPSPAPAQHPDPLPGL